MRGVLTPLSHDRRGWRCLTVCVRPSAAMPIQFVTSAVGGLPDVPHDSDRRAHRHTCSGCAGRRHRFGARRVE